VFFAFDCSNSIGCELAAQGILLGGLDAAAFKKINGFRPLRPLRLALQVKIARMDLGAVPMDLAPITDAGTV